MKRLWLLVVWMIVLGGCHDSIVNNDDGGGETWIELEFTLAQQSVLVGTPVGYTAELVAESGARTAASVAITSDVDPGLNYTANDITPTVVGTHTLTATATQDGATLTATASLVVEGGDPVSIEISLNDETPDIDQRVTVTAVILDAQGNELVDEPWTLTVTAEPGTDESSVTIDGHVMTFSQEGWFTATGTVDVNNGLTDSFGPFVVDSYAPTITITNPERGAWRTVSSEEVTGTITDSFTDIASATVNGAAVTLDEMGGFSHEVSYSFGTNMIETIATDGGGTTSTDRRSVLQGSFASRGGGIGDGIVARVNEGTINALEGYAEDLIAGYDIESMIPDPMVDMENEECVWSLCVTTYALELRVDNVRFGSVDIEIDPRSNGTIGVTGTINNISLDWDADGVLLEVGMSASGTISADAVTISMTLTPTVSGGQVHVTVSDVDVSSRNFVFDWDSWLYDVMDFFGLNLSSTVQGYVEGAIEDAVTSEVPPMLEDALQGLQLETAFDIMENSYTLRAVPDEISVDDAGMTLSLETHVTPAEWRSSREGLGSLNASYTPPAFGATPGLIAGFSRDFLNQALDAFWGGGLLMQELDAEALGVDPAMLALLLPELEDLQLIVVDGLLPPVVLPGEDGVLGELQVGDLQIDMYGGDPSNPTTLLLRMYVGITADLTLDVTPDATLSATVDNVEAWFDVTEPVMPLDFEVDTEELMVTLVPMLMGQITDALGEIPIPEISGFSMTDISIESAGPEEGYVNISGELSGL